MIKPYSKATNSIYNEVILERNVILPFSSLGKNIKPILEMLLEELYDGKCVKEGYIKHKTIKLVSHSNGLLSDNNIQFTAIFTCMICLPVENMIISCKIINITKAGIKAELKNEINNPMVIFISRDHHYNHANFSTLKENDIIKAKIIGHRFELYDE